ncbi:MAG: Hsp33 family molecular chaperone HslO [Methylophilaceae bacterium]|nr:Hsp33 family molecular chaperone HslO [Methylophilaceae bacterium]
MKSDLITRFIINNSSIRGNIIRIKNSLGELKKSLTIPEQLTSSFNEIITVCPMLAATLKFEGGLILQIQGKKSLKLIIAESDNDFKIRGTIKLSEHTNESFRDLIQDAIVALTVIHKDQKTPYQGIIEVGSGEIKAMIEHYLTQSMQIKSKVFFHQTKNESFGVLFQELPHENEEQKLITESLWNDIDLINSNALSDGPEQFLKNIFTQNDVQIFKEHAVQYECSCNQEKIYKTISLIQENEIYSSIKDDCIEMVCEYCHKKYTVTKEEIDIIFNKNQRLN